MKKLSTQRELLEAHRKKLDELYLEKYPNGKFCIQRMSDAISLHWVPKRNTSHVHKRGVSVFYALCAVKAGATQGLEVGQIAHRNYQGCSFGMCNNYDTLDKLLAACLRFECPNELIIAFSERYHARHSEGF